MNADIIQAKYDNLDSIAARFGQQAEVASALDSRVKQCVQALEQGGWEGKGSAAFFAEMYGEVLPATQRLNSVLSDARSVTLQAKDILIKAEQEAAAIFGNGVNSGTGGKNGNGVDTLLTGAKAGVEAWGKITQARKVLAALSLTYTMKDGNVIISGGRKLKEWAGLSPYLTRINPENLPLHMAKQGLKFSKVGALLDVLPSWLDDVKEYRKDGVTKVISAMAVDAAIRIPTGILSVSAGELVGGLAVVGVAGVIGVTAPAWAIVAGGVVGGIVVGMAAEEAGSWIESKTHIREHAIDAVDSAIHYAGKDLSSAAQHVDSAFDSAVGAISGVDLW